MEFLTNDKLTIVGAAGMIGSNMAQTAIMMHLTPNLCLYDPYAPGLEGVAEELFHCGFEGMNITFTSDIKEALTGAKYVVSSGGAARKAGMTREDLLKGNAAIAEEFGKNVKAYCPDVKHVVVIFNPADITGLITLLYSGLKPSQVTTLAALDSTRLRSELSKHFGIAPDKIENCRTYGGHGEQMAVYASTAKVDGKPLLDIIGTPALTKEQWVEIQTKVTKGGANIIALRGRSSFQSPAYVSIEMIAAAMGGKPFRWPAGTYVHSHGFDHIMMAMETEITKDGVHYKELNGTPEEEAKLKESYAHLCTLRDEVIEMGVLPAVEILTQHHLGVTVTRQTPDIKCYGAYILDPKTGKVDTYLAKVTLMATGGVGAVYKTTTNPLVATGDGIAMVYRAKGTVKDMEFVQFHPTALYHPGDRPSFLITEAMRGYGGVLRTMDGKEFMQKYDSRLSLAPRDIVARAIDNEMKNRGDDHVYLDVTHKDPEETKKHFPNIYEKCLSLGIDITKDYIPVAPAAHYLCGGILVDLDGQSSIERLYAVGECSCTGLHGGNRLASNSLIEAVVYADAAAKHSLQVVDQYSYNEDIPEWNDEGTRSPEEMVLITQSMKEVNQIMSTYVGIVRSDLRLKRAWDRLDIIYEETESLFKRSVASREICELRNMVNVGYLIMRQAMERKESRGLHYTIDYPHVKK